MTERCQPGRACAAAMRHAATLESTGPGRQQSGGAERVGRIRLAHQTDATMTISRRAFLIATAALPAGCVQWSRSGVADTSLARHEISKVRTPAVGEAWRYRVTDNFTRRLLSEETERVSRVDREVVIERHREIALPPEITKDDLGGPVLENSEARPASQRQLPYEIQRPWGSIALDPHWDFPQIYREPVPLWPSDLSPGWKRRVVTAYSVLSNGGALSWAQTMRAEEWELVSVPAGTFTALRYVNYIVYSHKDWSRIHCTRQETIWLAPEVGRWVKRTSSGTYYVNDTVDSSPYNEDSRTWELVEWS